MHNLHQELTRDLISRQNGSLASYGVIMLINQLLFVNRISRNIALAQDLNASSLEFFADHILCGLGVGMGLDEDECGVFERTAVGGRSFLGEDGGTGGAGEHKVVEEGGHCLEYFYPRAPMH